MLEQLAARTRRHAKHHSLSRLDLGSVVLEQLRSIAGAMA
jgi:hypothetical protein